MALLKPQQQPVRAPYTTTINTGSNAQLRSELNYIVVYIFEYLVPIASSAMCSYDHDYGGNELLLKWGPDKMGPRGETLWGGDPARATTLISESERQGNRQSSERLSSGDA